MAGKTFEKSVEVGKTTYQIVGEGLVWRAAGDPKKNLEFVSTYCMSCQQRVLGKVSPESVEKNGEVVGIGCRPRPQYNRNCK